MELDKNQHSVYSINYHLVMVIKYRRKVISDEIDDIKKAWDTGKYKRIVIGKGDGFFNTKISNISETRTPALYKELKAQLKGLKDYVNGTK